MTDGTQITKGIRPRSPIIPIPHPLSLSTVVKLTLCHPAMVVPTPYQQSGRLDIPVEAKDTDNCCFTVIPKPGPSPSSCVIRQLKQTVLEIYLRLETQRHMCSLRQSQCNPLEAAVLKDCIQYSMAETMSPMSLKPRECLSMKMRHSCHHGLVFNSRFSITHPQRRNPVTRTCCLLISTVQAQKSDKST